MSGPIRSPRVFGRPMWSWGGALTTRYGGGGPGRCHLKLRCRVARRVLWPLCRILTGHRQARGETGYGGGGTIDVFCAYCFFPWQVPVDEMPSAGFLVELFHGPTPKPPE